LIVVSKTPFTKQEKRKEKEKNGQSFDDWRKNKQGRPRSAKEKRSVSSGVGEQGKVFALRFLGATKSRL